MDWLNRRSWSYAVVAGLIISNLFIGSDVEAKSKVEALQPSLSERIVQILGEDFNNPKEQVVDDKHKTIIINKAYVDNPYESAKLLFTDSNDGHGTLLFSDSPEYVTENGILYRDIVSGNVRLLYYHLNDTDIPRRLAVVAENKDSKPVMITITREGVAGPSSDYLKVGKETLTEYFSPQTTRYVRLDVGQARLINPMEAGRILNHDGLVYGVYDMHTDGEVQFSVVMADANDDNMALYSRRAPLLDMDKHRLRGTFSGMNRAITTIVPYYPEKMGKAYIDLADNKIDFYKYGRDMLTHERTQNYGNYGVLYNIKLDVRGHGKTSYYLRPRGGVYAGAVLVRNLSKHTEELVQTPADMGFFGNDERKEYYAYLGTFDDNDKLEILFTPPGASNLPAQLILIPEK